MLRRVCAIVKATALEILSEPLVFLVTASAMALSVLAPAMHYHDFGEPSRMARDAGVSALLVGGLVIAAFGAVKTIRRELESQTAMGALALSVSRRCFFLSKFFGVLIAHMVFATAVGAVSMAAVRGTVVGAEISARTGGSIRIYGPIYALAVAAFVVPFVYGAVVNRFFRWRFTWNANLCAVVLALVAMGFMFDGSVFLKVLPLYALAALPAIVLLAAAAAFSTRFRFNAAATASVLVFAAFVPALGNYCLTDVLSAGESISWLYFLAAVAAILPLVAALLYLGVKLFENAE